MALLGTYEKSGGTTVSLCRYFYGKGAETLAARSEPQWRDWLTKTFGDNSQPTSAD